MQLFAWARMWNAMNFARSGVALLLLLTGCGPARDTVAPADADLEKEIAGIRAIDNHAHPVRVTGPGEPPDRGFDALPVDNMEPSSDPVNFRPGAAAALDAARALYGTTDRQVKQRLLKDKGEQYPSWVLDQMGVETMLANRVE